MKSRIRKWGNSLAVRIPRSLAEEIGLEEDAPVELKLIQGQITIRPERHYTLEELVAGITEENRHPETDSGLPVGNEVI